MYESQDSGALWFFSLVIISCPSNENLKSSRDWIMR